MSVVRGHKDEPGLVRCGCLGLSDTGAGCSLTPVVPAAWGAGARGLQARDRLSDLARPCLKVLRRGRDAAQWGRAFPSMHEALGVLPTTEEGNKVTSEPEPGGLGWETRP